MTYGSVWSREYIDAHPIPEVSKSLLPWLIKDRREAEEGATFYNSATGKDEHDRQGLQHAERELRRIKSDLALSAKTRDEGDRESSRTAILRWQATGQEEQVEFWRGKVYLLDKVIAVTQGRVE